MMGDTKKKVLETLKPLFEKADKEGLWFYSYYQDIWFSPKELREKHEKGFFLWGAVNWKLRDPRERLSQFKEEIFRIEQERNRFIERMAE
jgi:hypothetical protein